MKIDVVNLEGKKIKSIDLPAQFNEDYEPNLIKRAIIVIESRIRVPYGTMKSAGLDYSAKLSRRRRNYKGAYGKGISRVPRKTMWRRGMQFGWVGAMAPGTVGGRRAHPPKSEKIFDKDINVKERKKAIRSALSGLVKKNRINIIENTFENLTKVKETQKILENLGFKNEMKRTKDKTVRAGKGKRRGRKTKAKQGPIVIVSKKCNLTKVIGNLPGFEIEVVNNINTKLLTKGHREPRPTIWTEGAIEKLNKEALFTVKK